MAVQCAQQPTNKGRPFGVSGLCTHTTKHAKGSPPNTTTMTTTHRITTFILKYSRGEIYGHLCVRLFLDAGTDFMCTAQP